MHKLLTFLIALGAVAFGVCSPALVWAGSMTLLKAGNAASAVVGPPVLTYVGQGVGSTHSGSVATYTGVPIGTASGFTTRRIILAMFSNNGIVAASTIVSAVINGSIPATVHVQAGGSTPYAAIISADVPTGTTMDLVLTFDNTVFFTPFPEVYTVDDALLVSTTPQVGSASSATSVTSLTTNSFTQGSGGFIVAAGAIGANSTGYAVTGYTTDDFGGTTNIIAAHLAPSSSGSTTANATWGTSQPAALVAAAWR